MISTNFDKIVQAERKLAGLCPHCGVTALPYGPEHAGYCEHWSPFRIVKIVIHVTANPLLYNRNED